MPREMQWISCARYPLQHRLMVPYTVDVRCCLVRWAVHFSVEHAVSVHYKPSKQRRKQIELFLSTSRTTATAVCSSRRVWHWWVYWTQCWVALGQHSNDRNIAGQSNGKQRRAGRWMVVTVGHIERYTAFATGSGRACRTGWWFE